MIWEVRFLTFVPKAVKSDKFSRPKIRLMISSSVLPYPKPLSDIAAELVTGIDGTARNVVGFIIPVICKLC